MLVQTVIITSTLNHKLSESSPHCDLRNIFSHFTRENVAYICREASTGHFKTTVVNESISSRPECRCNICQGDAIAQLWIALVCQSTLKRSCSKPRWQISWDTFLNYFVSQFLKIHTCIIHDTFQSRFLKCWEYSGVTQKRQHKHGDNKRAVVCCRPVLMLMLLIQHYISSYMRVISISSPFVFERCPELNRTAQSNLRPKAPWVSTCRVN